MRFERGLTRFLPEFLCFADPSRKLPFFSEAIRVIQICGILHTVSHARRRRVISARVMSQCERTCRTRPIGIALWSSIESIRYEVAIPGRRTPTTFAAPGSCGPPAWRREQTAAALPSELGSAL